MENKEKTVRQTYRLTIIGAEKCNRYIREMREKRDDILLVGEDTNKNTVIPSTAEEIFEDALSVGIDDKGYIYSCWNVTDHHTADAPICLKLGTDFILRKM